jgi:hypothetical protein
MPNITCVYGFHIGEIAQKYGETVKCKEDRLSDLIDYLDTKYSGFKKELIDSATGGLATRNLIMVERGGENTHSLLSLAEEIRDGDILTFF